MSISKASMIIHSHQLVKRSSIFFNFFTFSPFVMKLPKNIISTITIIIRLWRRKLRRIEWMIWILSRRWNKPRIDHTEVVTESTKASVQ
jgi:hypothetical protein